MIFTPSTFASATFTFLLASLFAALVIPFVDVAGASEAREELTPLILNVADAPVPFTGSDGRIHLVYELRMTNFSSGDAALDKVEVIGDGIVLQTLDQNVVAQRLQPAGVRESTRTLGKSAQASLFINVALLTGAPIPKEISHRVTAHFAAAPPGHQEIIENGGPATVDRREVVQIGPPLRGAGYVSADSCCDATRHTRAALPVNGRVRVAQRFAVDWEQLDETGRIYSGPREKLESYAIFGKPVLAVADAVVEAVADDAKEETPGKYPTNIALDAADGNSVILNLGGNRYALYAHMQPHSIRVHAGERVKLGQTIGLVGDTGNSVAPHLHFQVMDGPMSLGSNGLPYEIDHFEITGESEGTEAFDKAEGEGTVLPITPVTPARDVRKALPLDQLIITF
jgi:hypothetical protein